MTEILFIRHAETDLAGTFCGHNDPPVNERGQAQIRQLIERLQSAPPAAIVSSDLQRARQTAEAIADAFDLDLSTDTALREIGFGRWEGLTWNQVEALDPVFAKRWIDGFPQVTPPGAEPFAVFRHRVLASLAGIACRHTGQRIAVVTHGGVMRLLLEEQLGRTPQDAWEAVKPYCSAFCYRLPADPSGVRV